MKKHISYFFPLGIVLGIWSLNDVLVRRFVMEYLSREDYLSYFTILAGLTPIIFTMSYILKYLEFNMKKRLFKWLHLIFIILAYVIPALIGRPETIYAIWNIIYFTSLYFIATMVYLAYDWYRQVKSKQELEKQNEQSELALLKNQINPHFLFNTLNNIDSLIKSNPDKASTSLVELSDIMRYMIYETKEELVPLEQELDYIDNYLNLQKMHYANPNLVSYQIQGNTNNITVPPMLFIPFIENAFKHSTGKEEEDAICFSFEIADNGIIFSSVNQMDKSIRISKDKSSGIGLEVVKRRLELLYPNKHSLVIVEKNNLFCVHLRLDLL